MQVVVSSHLGTEQNVLFRIALSLFPNFTFPPHPKPSQAAPAPVTQENDDDDGDICEVVKEPVSATRVPYYLN